MNDESEEESEETFNERIDVCRQFFKSNIFNISNCN